MINKQKVRNFIQDFGCARLEHLQILNDSENDNFKWLLVENMISQKEDIFVHNTKKIDQKMLIALDILCKYADRLETYHISYEPVLITFYSTENLTYNIIVADEHNKRRIVGMLNNYRHSLPKCDRIIVAFPDESEFYNINEDVPVAYAVYPGLEIVNEETDEDEESSE